MARAYSASASRMVCSGTPTGIELKDAGHHELGSACFGEQLAQGERILPALAAVVADDDLAVHG